MHIENDWCVTQKKTDRGFYLTNKQHTREKLHCAMMTMILRWGQSELQSNPLILRIWLIGSLRLVKKF